MIKEFIIEWIIPTAVMLSYAAIVTYTANNVNGAFMLIGTVIGAFLFLYVMKKTSNW